VIACVIVTFFIFTHRIPEGALALLVMYFMAQEDTGTTLLGSVLGIVGVTVGCGAALLAWMLAMDVPWLRFGLLFTFFTTGLFLGRALVLGLIALPMGVAATFLLVVPDVIHEPESALDFLLWTWWVVILGIATNLAVQWWLSPGDPLRLIDQEVAQRLGATESVLRERLGDALERGRHGAAERLALAGLLRPEKLLRVARLRHPGLGARGSELSVMVTFAQRLVDAAAVLGALPRAPLGRGLEEQLRHTAEECARLRSAAEVGILSAAAPPPIHFTSATPLAESSGPIAEIERALAGVREAWPRGSVPSPPADEPRAESGMPLFVSDAFTNPDYIRFGVKGALAGLICYVLLEATDWPGIYTAIITCYVVPLSSLGATVQKATLRFAGAATGGLLGMIALAAVFPYLDDVGGFWIVLSAGTAVAAWLTFGSARISYAGIQLGFAFYKCVLQGYGPATSFEVARDRLIGIALGLTVLWVIETQLWPVRANDQLCTAFSATLRSLAKLIPRNTDEDARHPSVESIRQEVEGQLERVGALLEESRFEPEDVRREAVQRSFPEVQGVFLMLLSLAHETGARRQDVSVDLFRTAETELDREIATALEATAEGRSAAFRPNVDAALARLEITANEQTSEKLAIYRRLVLHLNRVSLEPLSRT
jgi:multidrug resistance protein MdtO